MLPQLLTFMSFLKVQISASINALRLIVLTVSSGHLMVIYKPVTQRCKKVYALSPTHMLRRKWTLE
jgi:hypothetical protein